jgi:hypothetical protein
MAIHFDSPLLDDAKLFSFCLVENMENLHRGAGQLRFGVIGICPPAKRGWPESNV